jgi:cold shock CspA family protein
MLGVVQNYYPLKGCGFILSGFNKRIFFHITNFNERTVPVIGTRVEFDLGPAYKPGLPDQAVRVIPAETTTEGAR